MSPPVAVPASIGFAPGRLPLLGHALALRYRPLEFLGAQRGRGDIVVFWIGPKRAYMVNNSDLVRQLLTVHKNDFLKGGPLFEAGRVLVGNGLIISNGDLHRKQRRLIQPSFHPSRFPGYVAIMAEAAAARAASWRDGQLLRIDQEMRDLSTTVLGRCLYSGLLSSEMVSEVARSLPIITDGIGRRGALPIRWLHALPTRENRRFTSALHRFHSIVDRLIDDRKTAAADHEDMVSMLLAVRDEETGEAMAHQQVHDEIITLITAGSETTAVAISWALYLIAAHPSVERRIVAELQQVLGGRPITHADLPRLDYLARVVTETLRMYPPVWILPRRTTADTELGGHLIPRGSYVFYSPYANHHDPRLFVEPERFDPDRWLPEQQAKHLPRCAYIPFGAGARRCVGDTFGTTEAMVALATIITRWRLRPHTDEPVRPHAFASLQTGELRMIAEHRTSP